MIHVRVREGSLNVTCCKDLDPCPCDLLGEILRDRTDLEDPCLPCAWPVRWPERGGKTRSHPELGRETPQRRWYCVARPGRVGRRRTHRSRQAQSLFTIPLHDPSSPRPSSSEGAGRPSASNGAGPIFGRDAHV